MANILHRVAQDPQLRRVPVLEDDFEPPVVVNVGQDEGAAVIRKIQPHDTGDLRKSAIAIVSVENISFGTSSMKNPTGSVH